MQWQDRKQDQKKHDLVIGKKETMSSSNNDNYKTQNNDFDKE